MIVALSLLFWSDIATAAETIEPTLGQGQSMVEYHAVAIEDVCAWPNLTAMADGAIVVTLFNKPSHGKEPGDTECWATTDKGRTWVRRGTAAPREKAEYARMNFAAGRTPSGDLIVVCGGWEDPGSFKTLLSPVVRVSSDGGNTWNDPAPFPKAADGTAYVPFGDILPGEDGALRVACYTASSWQADVLRSENGGRSWEQMGTMGRGLNECAWVHLGGGRWLATVRTVEGAYLRAFRSFDDGKTWTDSGRVTEDNHHPGHLLQLHDGRLLLSYGDRSGERFGIEARLGNEEGTIWGPPLRLADFEPADCGYPSSVQLFDGKVLTAYYAQKSSLHNRYHMAVVVWNPPKVPQETE